MVGFPYQWVSHQQIQSTAGQIFLKIPENSEKQNLHLPQSERDTEST